ncbi:hypothetical protein CAEBREN_06226 [Caenorhabditis brenneri]|uniref:E1 ubiquitin-activating enzyme n=1 Tax=Caenorhabditis brenneri TaxID=135651 RepID=G0NRY7_CAEBE|nr:hypothetical protein CAEBREN_06226 [Caenorhabditis brenneri]
MDILNNYIEATRTGVSNSKILEELENKLKIHKGKYYVNLMPSTEIRLINFLYREIVSTTADVPCLLCTESYKRNMIDKHVRTRHSNAICPKCVAFNCRCPLFYQCLKRKLGSLEELRALLDSEKSEKTEEERILIAGLGSVGVEIAKNLIIGGVRHVTIQDTKLANWIDLSAQYYLREEDVGHNRATACYERLAELNDSVNVEVSTNDLTENFVKNFDLVVLTDTSRSAQLRIAAWIRAHNRRVLIADARGVFSYIFNDFGSDFRVDDATGEQVREFFIEHIDRTTGEVTTLKNLFHGLEDGDHVTFSEVKGLDGINGCDPIKITVTNASKFNIGDFASSFPDYIEGGRCKQVKVPTSVSHLPFEKSLKEPEFCIRDFTKFEHAAELHSLWTALYAFEEKHGRSPLPRSSDDVILLKSLLPEGSEEIPDKLIEMFSFSAAGNLVTVSSVVGGIAAQEAMKAVTHHMTPLKQWLHLDHVEALPGDWTTFDNAKLLESDCQPRQSRYDGQAAVFGWPYQECLFRQRWFIVGAGAIGCELLKNLAMMGVACGEGGLIKITDMDQIEISNLNRQFLFRRRDVGGKKSECAARAVTAFNSDVRIEALAERVGIETEHIFNDDFFGELNGVANALDNVDARRYMDRRCVCFRVPLIFMDTMGHMGMNQVVFPLLTESYSNSIKPIDPVDQTNTKQIAGKIIPAIATTTAAVAGLVCIEVYKMVDANGVPKTPLDRFKNTFLNLSMPHFSMAEPIAAPRKTYLDREFTLWDRIDVQGPLTLQEFLDDVQRQTGGCEVSMLSAGTCLLFSFFMNAAKKQERLRTELKLVYEELLKKPLHETVRAIVLEPIMTGPNGEDVEVPHVRYSF